MPRPTNDDAMRVANAKRTRHFHAGQQPVEVPTPPCFCTVRKLHYRWVITCNVHGEIHQALGWAYAIRRADKHARGEL